RSTLTNNDKMTLKEFNQWVEKYDKAGVLEEDVYPLQTRKKIEQANQILTSDFKRSIQSAELLHPNATSISDSLFRETELPRSLPIVKGIKLNPGMWAVLLRCLWLAGYSRDCESMKEAKTRAGKAAEVLVEQAKKHFSVVLIGHGFLNRFIGNELHQKGLKRNERTSSKHWHATTYTLFNARMQLNH